MDIFNITLAILIIVNSYRIGKLETNKDKE